MFTKGGKIGVLALGSAVFCLFFSVSSAAAVVIINEIAWMGTTASANHEWLELYNQTGAEIILDGWTLLAADGTPSVNLVGRIGAGGYFLLERTSDDTAPAVAADLIYTGALGNTGEILVLRDAQGNVMDQVEASAGWPAGDNNTKQTMSRAPDSSWQTSADAGGTPKTANMIARLEQPDEENDPAETGGSAEENQPPASSSPAPADHQASAPFVRLGEAVINEFVSDPADGEEEWVEIFNTTEKIFSLAGWTLEEGSGARTVLSGQLLPFAYHLVKKPKGSLNNGGDAIILCDQKGGLLDQLAYGDWDDGQTADNAPKAPDPGSTARKINGYNSFNNSFDFIYTLTPTPGASNIIALPQARNLDQQTDNSSPSDQPDDNLSFGTRFVISEIFPNPIGDDSENEFIEVYNRSDREADLTGWRLGDLSARVFTIKAGTSSRANIIPARGYLAIYRRQSKIALNNNGDSVKLYAPSRTEPALVVPYEKAPEAWSFALASTSAAEIGNNQWHWTKKPTPGAENLIEKIQHPPAPSFSCPEEIMAGQPVLFDSSDTIDEDNDPLAYFWDFGDGASSTLAFPEHTFFQPGSYLITLLVSDGENEGQAEKVLFVRSVVEPFELSDAPADPSAFLLINEFFPDPDGDDAEGEFIELYNPGPRPLDLFGWQVDDSEGGSRPYRFSLSSLLNPENYYVLERSESGLALNNTSDRVRLFSPAGLLTEEIAYEKSVAGSSYARTAGQRWQWTSAVTPGGKNIFIIPNSLASKSTVKKSKVLKHQSFAAVSLDKIKDCDVGDWVSATGAVAVLPGVLGSQYFYLSGAAGIQVYNYKKEFPRLQVGDLVSVSGEISVLQGEKRIKTKNLDDIVVLASGSEPASRPVLANEITEELAGALVRLSGEIVERKSSTVYLDDQNGEVPVYIKAGTGLDAKKFAAGDYVTATGIVSRTNSGLRILPRSPADLVKIQVAGAAGPAEVLGQVSPVDRWEIAARDQRRELFTYLLILAGALNGALLWRRVRLWRETRNKQG